MTGRGDSTAMRLSLLTLAVLAAATAPAKQPHAYAGPVLTATSAVILDAESGRVLFERNADMRRPPASTTKIMTGLLLAEKCRPDDIITAPADIQVVKESSMHLLPGEQIKAGELLFAMMLRSANDGCHAAAVHIAGSDAAFAKIMNDRAAAIGCKNTTFVNPHGLHDPKHLTTAYDLALIAREAMKNERFAQAVKTQKKSVERSLNTKDTLMVSRNKWLRLDPSSLGVKTGYTKPAGHCFVGCAERDGMKLVTVILDSKDWVKDQIALNEWGYENYELRDALQDQAPVEVPVVNGNAPTVAGQAEHGLILPLPTQGGVDVDVEFVPTPELKAPVKAGEEIGAYLVTYDRGQKVRIPVLASGAVSERPALASVLSAPTGILGVVLIGGAAVAVRARSKKMAASFSSP